MQQPTSAYLSFIAIRFSHDANQNDNRRPRPTGFTVYSGEEELHVPFGTLDAKAIMRTVTRREITYALANAEKLNRWIEWAIAHPIKASADVEYLSSTTLVRVLLKVTPDAYNPENYSVSSIAIENDKKDWHEFSDIAGDDEALEDALQFLGGLIANILQDYPGGADQASHANAHPAPRIIH